MLKILSRCVVLLILTDLIKKLSINYMFYAYVAIVKYSNVMLSKYANNIILVK